MRFTVCLIIALFTISCSNREPMISIVTNSLEKSCQFESSEFLEFYQDVDKIRNDDDEILFIVEALKKEGYAVSKWGRGNWEYGPRIVSYTMTKNDCLCRIDKLYYTVDYSGNYKVTEKIECQTNKDESN